MFEHIILEPEQEELLVKLVEAWRNVPREGRQKFTHFDVVGGSFLLHPGLPSTEIPAYLGDIEVLERAGLVSISLDRGRRQINIVPVNRR